MTKALKLMPGPKSWPVFGSTLNYTRFGEFSFDRLYLAKMEYLKRFGPIYKERLGPATFVHLYRPDDIATVFRHEGKTPNRPVLPLLAISNKRDGHPLGLGSLNGNDWYNLRRSVNKFMMHPRAATAYLKPQNVVADDFVSLINQNGEQYTEVPDFYELLHKYMMEAMGTLCFNTRLDCLAKEIRIGSEAHNMLTGIGEQFHCIQMTNFAFPWYLLFPTPTYKKFVKAREECESIANSYISEAMTRNNVTEESEDVDKDPNFLKNLVKMRGLSLKEAVGITIDLFTAGIDSATSAAGFVMYNLARNPDKQKKLTDQIDAVLPPGEAVTEDMLLNLPYLKACVKESFRLNFPVEGGTTRQLDCDLELGGYLVPKGTFAFMNNQTLCRLERYFDNPTEYIPERWLRDGSNTLRPPPPYTMLPFGYGPRMCIGRRFAEQQIYLAVIKILQKYRIEYHGPEIGMVCRIFTMLDKPLRLRFYERRR